MSDYDDEIEDNEAGEAPQTDDVVFEETEEINDIELDEELETPEIFTSQGTKKEDVYETFKKLQKTKAYKGKAVKADKSLLTRIKELEEQLRHADDDKKIQIQKKIDSLDSKLQTKRVKITPSIRLPFPVEGIELISDSFRDGQLVYVKDDDENLHFYTKEQYIQGVEGVEEYVVADRQLFSTKFYEYVQDKTLPSYKTVYTKSAYGGKGGYVKKFAGDKTMFLEDYLNLVNQNIQQRRKEKEGTPFFSDLTTSAQMLNIAKKYQIPRDVITIVTEPGIIQLDPDVTLLKIDEKRVVFDGKNYIVKEIPKEPHKIRVPNENLEQLSIVELMLLVKEKGFKLPDTTPISSINEWGIKESRFRNLNKKSLVSFMKKKSDEWFLPQKWNVQYDPEFELLLDDDGNIIKNDKGKALIISVEREPTVLSRCAEELLKKANTVTVSVATLQELRRISSRKAKLVAKLASKRLNRPLDERIHQPVSKEIRVFIRRLMSEVFKNFFERDFQKQQEEAQTKQEPDLRTEKEKILTTRKYYDEESMKRDLDILRNAQNIENQKIQIDDLNPESHESYSNMTWSKYLQNSFDAWVRNNFASNHTYSIISEKDYIEKLTDINYELFNGGVFETSKLMQELIPLLNELALQLESKDESCYRVNPSTLEIDREYKERPMEGSNLVETFVDNLTTKRYNDNLYVPSNVSLKQTVAKLESLREEFKTKSQTTKVASLSKKYKEKADIIKHNLKLLKVSSIPKSITQEEQEEINTDLDILQETKFQRETNKRFSDVLKELEEKFDSISDIKEKQALKTRIDLLKKDLKNKEKLSNLDSNIISEEEINLMTREQISAYIEELQQELTIDQAISQIRSSEKIMEIVNEEIMELFDDIMPQEEFELKQTDKVRKLAIGDIKRKKDKKAPIIFKLQQRLDYMNRNPIQFPKFDTFSKQSNAESINISEIIQTQSKKFQKVVDSGIRSPSGLIDIFSILNTRRQELYSDVATLTSLLNIRCPSEDVIINETVDRLKKLKDLLSLKTSVNTILQFPHYTKLLQEDLQSNINFFEQHSDDLSDLDRLILENLYTLKSKGIYSKYSKLKDEGQKVSLPKQEMILLLEHLDREEMIDDGVKIVNIIRLLKEKSLSSITPSKWNPVPEINRTRSIDEIYYRIVGDIKYSEYEKPREEYVKEIVDKISTYETPEELMKAYLFIVAYDQKSSSELEKILARKGITISVKNINTVGKGEGKDKEYTTGQVWELAAMKSEKNRLIYSTIEKYISRWQNTRDNIRQIVIQTGKRMRNENLKKEWKKSIDIESLAIAYQLEQSMTTGSEVPYPTVKPEDIKIETTEEKVAILEQHVYDKNSNDTWKYLSKMSTLIEFINDNKFGKRAAYFKKNILSGFYDIKDLHNAQLNNLLPELLFADISNEKYEWILSAIKDEIRNLNYTLFLTYEFGKDPSMKRNIKDDAEVFIDVSSLDKVTLDVLNVDVVNKNKEVICYNDKTNEFHCVNVNEAKKLINQGKITDPITVNNVSCL